MVSDGTSCNDSQTIPKHFQVNPVFSFFLFFVHPLILSFTLLTQICSHLDFLCFYLSPFLRIPYLLHFLSFYLSLFNNTWSIFSQVYILLCIHNLTVAKWTSKNIPQSSTHLKIKWGFSLSKLASIYNQTPQRYLLKKTDISDILMCLFSSWSLSQAQKGLKGLKI